MRLVRVVFFLLSLSQEYSSLFFNLVALVTRGWVVFDSGIVSWEDLVTLLEDALDFGSSLGTSLEEHDYA